MCRSSRPGLIGGRLSGARWFSRKHDVIPGLTRDDVEGRGSPAMDPGSARLGRWSGMAMCFLELGTLQADGGAPVARQIGLAAVVLNRRSHRFHPSESGRGRAMHNFCRATLAERRSPHYTSPRFDDAASRDATRSSSIG